MEDLHLYSPVTALSGIKTVRAKQLQQLGIRTLYDLIAYFPRAYEDRSRIVPISELSWQTPACFEAMVISQPRTAHIRKGLDLTKCKVADETGTLNLTFFNQPYVADSLRYGKSYRFFGKLQEESSNQMQSPVFEPVETAGRVTGRLFPIYGLTAGLSNLVIQKAVQQALDAVLDTIPDILPEEIRRLNHLCSARHAYAIIHAPENEDVLAQAKRRVIFEEFFIFTAGLMQLRARRQKDSVEPYDVSCQERFLQALPFRMTDAQDRVCREILSDLSSGQPMNRLVQGDVGSGKTMVAAAAAYCTVQNGRQAALLVPTEILAEQHLATLEPLMTSLGVRTVLLTGSMTAAQKKAAKTEIESGAAQLVIGTHALLTGDVQFSQLGLVVADEQHRFGVAQRTAMTAKGRTPHLLVMSATPIPRTLALIAYGDLDLSVIDQLPPGRLPVDTYLVGENMRRRINAFIRKQCEEGGQVYIVCPAIEESDMESLKSAQVWAETLQSTVFPDLRVGLLHGKMKGTEKEAIMADFSAHRLDILVSTTVIEVGMDVPNANLMVIENADRFGLSQLHQLRGRVGRGQRKSYCVLFSSSRSEETISRLKAFTSTNNGFEIAEKDLQLRGPGDFFGSRQHGVPMLKVGSLQLDLEILVEAQEAAAASLKGDWASRPEYAPLLQRIEALFQEESVSLN